MFWIMASLSNTKIKDTYESLVKFSDNGNITIGAKQLTDGCLLHK